MNLHAAFQLSEPFLLMRLPAGLEQTETDMRIYSGEAWSQVVLQRFPSQRKKPAISIERKDYCDLVRDAVKNMQAGKFQKVVLSRIQRVLHHAPGEPSLLFERLCAAYPEAMVYACRTPEGELWMGATPELLLKKRNDRFETLALAGTQPWVENKSAHEYEWGDKERQEQKLVTEFIVSRLAEMGATETDCALPVTLRAGGIVHLASVIKFAFRGSAAEAASWLHPTPAVGGTPAEQALRYIDEYEPHSRSYYAGIVGVENAQGDADLFVNLRCMRVWPHAFELFTGAGITAASIPEDEWEETEWKAQTLLRIIRS